MQKDIILFGIQGSGKGTQAQLLLKEFPALKYLESWNVFRAITSNNNIISEYIKGRKGVPRGLLWYPERKGSREDPFQSKNSKSCWWPEYGYD